MKADVYTTFLRGKSENVKAFGTTRNTGSCELSKRFIRRVTPFLLASAMAFTMSGKGYAQTSPQTSEKVLTEIYQDVISRYHLTELQEKEPFSQAEIQGLLNAPNPPKLTDTNFNHQPQNQENFWEIVRNGIAETNKIRNSNFLPANIRQEYKIMAFKMLSQMSRVKGTQNEVDLKDYNNLKAFLYFEKVIEYKSNYLKVLRHQDGDIDEKSEAFGRYYQQQEKLANTIQNNTGIIKFAKALYASSDKFMLNTNDSVKANEISRRILADWLQKQNIKDKGLWRYVNADDSRYPNTLALFRTRGNRLRASLDIDPRGYLGDGLYSPVGSVLIHEIEHVMQKEPSSKELPEDNLKDEGYRRIKYMYDDYIGELGPTLHSLAIEDQIYKEINGIGKDKVVNYGSLDFGTHKVNVGEVAVWFNQMLEKYPHSSIDDVLLEKEVQTQLQNWGNGNNMQLQNVQSTGR